MVPPVNLIPVDAVAHIIFLLSSAQRGLHCEREFIWRNSRFFFSPLFWLWYILLIPACIRNKTRGWTFRLSSPLSLVSVISAILMTSFQFELLGGGGTKKKNRDVTFGSHLFAALRFGTSKLEAGSGDCWQVLKVSIRLKFLQLFHQSSKTA